MEGAFRGLHRGLPRSEEHTSELQSPFNLVCRLLLEKKKKKNKQYGDGCRGTRSPASRGVDRAHVSPATRGYASLPPRVAPFFLFFLFFFFFNDTATTEIYTLSLHDALPILLNTPKSFQLTPVLLNTPKSFQLIPVWLTTYMSFQLIPVLLNTPKSFQLIPVLLITFMSFQLIPFLLNTPKSLQFIPVRLTTSMSFQ